MSEQTARRLTITSGNLAALAKHPSWPDLETAVEEKRQRIHRSMLVEALYLSTSAKLVPPADQRKLDWARGFIAGMEYVVAVPTNAESSLERTLKEQGIRLVPEKES